MCVHPDTIMAKRRLQLSRDTLDIALASLQHLGHANKACVCIGWAAAAPAAAFQVSGQPTHSMALAAACPPTPSMPHPLHTPLHPLVAMPVLKTLLSPHRTVTSPPKTRGSAGSGSASVRGGRRRPGGRPRPTRSARMRTSGGRRRLSGKPRRRRRCVWQQSVVGVGVGSICDGLHQQDGVGALLHICWPGACLCPAPVTLRLCTTATARLSMASCSWSCFSPFLPLFHWHEPLKVSLRVTVCHHCPCVC